MTEYLTIINNIQRFGFSYLDDQACIETTVHKIYIYMKYPEKIPEIALPFPGLNLFNMDEVENSPVAVKI